jgi:hypothetical protein
MDHKTSSREPGVLLFCKRLTSDTGESLVMAQSSFVGRGGVPLFMLREGRPSLSASRRAC